MRLNKVVHTIHAYTALILAVFIVMYALSGFIMLHGSWFPDSKNKTKRQVTISEMKEAVNAREPSDMSSFFQDELGLRGRLTRKPELGNDGNWEFEYSHPGTTETVEWEPGTDEVVLTVRTGGFSTVMNRLHQWRGFYGGPGFFLWGLLVDLVAAAMILFAFSGIYLWYTRKRDRRLGWLILGASTAYTIGSIVYLVVSP